MGYVLKSKKRRVTLKYGKTLLNGRAYNHTGIDLVKSPSSFDDIVAIQSGKVVATRKSYKGRDLKGGYGNYVKIEHGLGIVSIYCHLAYNSIKVKTGDIVKSGEVIGTMGDTGYTFGGHLHFEIREFGKVVDPTPYLGSKKVPEYGAKPAEPKVTTKKVTYTVKKGDTLNKIAKKYGVSVASIVKSNKIANKNLIITGDKLTIVIDQSSSKTASESKSGGQISVGMTVIIVKGGNSNSNGNGINVSKKMIGKKRKVMKILKGKSCPILIGINGSPTGWYKSSGIREV